MGKFIAIIIIVAVAVWAYFHVDFANFKTNATNTFKKEKTINSVLNSRDQNNEAAQKALEGF